MASLKFPRLSERVFAVRAAWRRQVPLRIRVEAVRKASAEAAALAGNDVPVKVNAEGRAPQERSFGGPPVRLVDLNSTESRVA